jgi:hypothetical protein
LLRDTLATRDQITADLAKGDEAALSEIQPVLSNSSRLRSIDASVQLSSACLMLLQRENVVLTATRLCHPFLN